MRWTWRCFIRLWRFRTPPQYTQFCSRVVPALLRLRTAPPAHCTALMMNKRKLQAAWFAVAVNQAPAAWFAVAVNQAPAAWARTHAAGWRSQPSAPYTTDSAPGNPAVTAVEATAGAPAPAPLSSSSSSRMRPSSFWWRSIFKRDSTAGGRTAKHASAQHRRSRTCGMQQYPPTTNVHERRHKKYSCSTPGNASEAWQPPRTTHVLDRWGTCWFASEVGRHTHGKDTCACNKTRRTTQMEKSML